MEKENNFPIEFEIGLEKMKTLYEKNLYSVEEIIESIVFITKKYDLSDCFIDYAFEKLGLFGLSKD